MDLHALSSKEPITDGWLKEAGFRWHQVGSQPHRHWILWLGSAISDPVTGRRGMLVGAEDLGIEVALSNLHGDWPIWFCWLRSDTAHRYYRFIHVRHVRWRCELISLVAVLTGQEWNPSNHLHGAVHAPDVALRMREEEERRFDRQLRKQEGAWYSSERDPDRGRPLREHLDAAIESGKAL